MKTIKIAIVGAGNCASAFVQGLSYYVADTDAPSDYGNNRPGLITPILGGYRPRDIEIVAAFDVVEGKAGEYLDNALNAAPNNTLKFAIFPYHSTQIKVSRGPTLDGLGQYLSHLVKESPIEECDVVEILKQSKADIVINYLPVGSEEAARYYAQAALDAGCAFINCMPTFIASDPLWAAKFKDAGLPIIGDDVKSQVGATIVHRVLATLFRERGVRLLRTSQLNVGGNSDFYNMLERERLLSKKISKTQAVTSVMGVELPGSDVHIGPSDHVPWLNDRKWAHIRLEGEGFGGTPINIELKLEVVDSPNSAGVVFDAVRCARVALDRGEAGAIIAPSSWFMKSPPEQMDDDVANTAFHDWLDGAR